MTTRDLQTRLDDWGRCELRAIENDMGLAAADPFTRPALHIARRRLVVRTAAITTLIVLALTFAGWKLATTIEPAPPSPAVGPR